MAWWALFAAATAAQAVSQVSASQQRAAQMREQARIAAMQGEAQLIQAEFQADVARQQGREQAQYIRRQSRRNVGRMVAGTASRGIEIQGSPAMVIADQIWQDEKAASTAIINAELGAMSAEARGQAGYVSGMAERSRLRQAAGFTETAGWLNAFSTAVGGYATYYGATQ